MIEDIKLYDDWRVIVVRLPDDDDARNGHPARTYFYKTSFSEQHKRAICELAETFELKAV